MKIALCADHLMLTDFSRNTIDELMKDYYLKGCHYIVTPFDESTYGISASKQELYDFVFIATIMLSGIYIE